MDAWRYRVAEGSVQAMTRHRREPNLTKCNTFSRNMFARMRDTGLERRCQRAGNTAAEFSAAHLDKPKLLRGRSTKGQAHNV